MNAPHDGAQEDDRPPASTRVRDARTVFAIALVSLVYFADMLLRASRKPFWLDELYTVYLCRLPNFLATWTAVKHGADFNPPLFYALTRFSRIIFGEGPIASRLPEIIGVWIFGCCLFSLVSRRMGRTAGLIAAIFPFFSLAQYYAYEARAHGITLAWCGLALISWQRIVEAPTRVLWYAAFTLSLSGGVLTHVYGVFLFVPFALFEIYSLLRYRKLRWGVLAALALSTAVALPVDLILLHGYKQVIQKPDAARTLAVTDLRIFVDVLHSFASKQLGDSTYFFLLFLALAAIAAFRNKEAREKTIPAILGHPEFVLAICFVLLPVFGLAGTVLIRGQFYDRYFLSFIAGVAILFGYASCLLKRGQPSLQRILAAGFVLLMFGDLISIVMNTVGGRSDRLVEPSTSFEFPVLHHRTSVDLDKKLLALDADVPIVDLDGVTYLFYHYYAPSFVGRRLSYGGPNGNDVGLKSYQLLAQWAHVDLRVIPLDDFLAQQDHFYILDSPVRECWLCLKEIGGHGFVLQAMDRFSDGDLYEFKKP